MRVHIQYIYPALYDFWIGFFHTERLLDYLRKEIGLNESIFDVGAGYGRMASITGPSHSYHGIDLNEVWVRKGQKKGISLEVKSFFEPTAYRKTDIFLIVDIIHHLSDDELKRLFDLVFQHAQQKVIIMEPSFESQLRRYGIFKKLAGWIFRILDNDGFSKIPKLLMDAGYEEFFENRFGSTYGEMFRAKHQKIDRYHLVTFTRNKKEAADHRL